MVLILIVLNVLFSMLYLGFGVYHARTMYRSSSRGWGDYALLALLGVVSAATMWAAIAVSKV